MPIRPPVLIALLTALCLPVAEARDPMQSMAPAPARADTQRSAAEPARARLVSEVDTQQQELLIRQKRRDDLRETLRVQSEEGSTTARQLTAQEKMELRQQLRQQQEWLNK